MEKTYSQSEELGSSVTDELAIIREVPRDTLREKQVKKFRVETPIGNVESESGNHLIDVASVVIVVILFFVIKRFFKAT